ncbi:unnamed protein product [Prorocentrum cordatum]|uniref:Carbohydrate kinase PfkB domain-containing protein n=1 Tax=Prorocentrum cordatum TaxID=2364126 RepID=A0ABN9TCY2_9DINO|nr:unnamed protein product [Polarella glacialis]
MLFNSKRASIAFRANRNDDGLRGQVREPSPIVSLGWWLAPRALGALGLLAAMLAWRAETGRGSLVRLGLGAALMAVAAFWVAVQTVRGWWRAASGHQAEVEALRAQLASLSLDGAQASGPEARAGAGAPELPAWPAPSAPPPGLGQPGVPPAPPHSVDPAMDAFHAFAAGGGCTGPLSWTAAPSGPPAQPEAGAGPTTTAVLPTVPGGGPGGPGLQAAAAAAACAKKVKEALLNTKGFAQQLHWLKRGWRQYFPAFDMAPKGYVKDKNTGGWIKGPDLTEENVPPLPSPPGTPSSWVQCVSAPPSRATSRTASPGAVSLVLTPPKAKSPGTLPPATVLAIPPPEAAGQPMTHKLQFYAQAPCKPQQTRAQRGSYLKSVVGYSRVLQILCGPCFAPAIILTVLVVSFPSSLFPNMSRGAEAAASLVEDVAGAGGAVALAARNLTLAVSGGWWDSATFVDEAWSGIDLLGCRLNVTGGRFVVDIGARSRPSMMKELERGLSVVPDDLAVELWGSINAVSVRAPVAARLSSQFNFTESFFIWDWEVLLVDEEVLAVRYYFARLGFELQWANPLWALTGADPGRELERITTRVKDAIESAVDASVLRTPLTAQEEHGLPPGDATPVPDTLAFARLKGGAGVPWSPEEACRAASALCELAVVTLGSGGVWVARGRGAEPRLHPVQPAEPAKVVDSTGAGDFFAGGFLGAWLRGLPEEECVRWGSAAAVAVLSAFGTDLGRAGWEALRAECMAT